MTHAFINVIVPFEFLYSSKVEGELSGLIDDNNGNLPCASVEKSLTAIGIIHFMSMTVVDARCPSERNDPQIPNGPSHLVIEISSDRSAEETLSMLADRLGAELLRILNAANIQICQHTLAGFLFDHNYVIGAKWGSDAVGQVFTGSPGMTVRRICGEQYLAARIGGLIDEYRKPRPSTSPQIWRGWYESSPRQRLERIRDDLWIRNIADSAPDEGNTKWAYVAEPAPCLAGDPRNRWTEEISLANPQVWKALISVLSTLLGPFFLPFSLISLAALVFVGWHFEHIHIGYLLAGLTAFTILLVLSAKRGRPRHGAMLVVVAALVYAGWRNDANLESTWIAYGIIGLFVGLFIVIEVAFQKFRWLLYPVFTIVAALVLLWLFQLSSIAFLVLGLIMGFAWAFALITGTAGLLLLHLEKVDVVEDQTPPTQQVEALMKVENFCAQNHLASISRLKPGLLRRLVLRLFFIIVGTGKLVCPPGFLGKNGVIHFARWMVLPGTDQLLFWSNYDNTWQAYVGDFIADAPTGVTGIWSNCVGFPKTKNVILDGAMDRDRLVRWARRQQHPTTFWYSAYSNLTADRIRTNAAIRQGFASAETDADVRDWFTLFGSKPVPADTLQTSQLPTLVLGGLSSMRYSVCNFIAFKDKSKARNWLAEVARRATYGEVLPGQNSATVIAFTARGLCELGISADAMETFPAAFQQGMWPDYRARMLGDTGNNAPKNWIWGSDDSIHALLLVYGTTEAEMMAADEAIPRDADAVEFPTASLQLAPLPEKDGPSGQYAKEHFKFVDGVSQPVIRGSARAKSGACATDIVAPGELVLGYEDNLGKIPPSPSISDEHDPDHILPDCGPDPLRRRPEFSRYEGTGRRDLGANGTFLVVRQLEQNVKAFEGWLDQAVDQIKHEVIVAADSGRVTGKKEGIHQEHAGMCGRSGGRMAVIWGSPAQEASTSGPPSRPLLDVLPRIDWSDPESRRKIQDFIAAKLVGRWRDGTSLVRHPMLPGSEQCPPEAPDNEFLLGKEDPAGIGCPFGAHIRRANPRETRFPGDEEEIATTNRHRILRIGRRYGVLSNDDSPKGLLFMCLNADIERQFEFIQKTWLLNPNIHGLENEVDPILGQGTRNVTIPTTTGPIRLTIAPDFVQMKGGGYFFLPGRAVLRYLAEGRMND